MTDAPQKHDDHARSDGAGATTAAHPLDGHLGFILRRAQLGVFQELTGIFGAYDLRPAQFAVLKVIEARPGISQSEAAESISVKTTNFATLIAQMEARDLVRRETSPTDRRGRMLFLTPGGQTICRDVTALWADYERRLTERLGGDDARAALVAMLKALDADTPS
ncbi:MarR family winged helix-turn-helix transcriptional regulator [Amorphus orientalis]|uniref:DNA-binding MarR family transcriptional regulator n=1 Tax=Amorphus orientalis TaxID=649198 RepID=A0AAE4ASY7_9HYPH|nr:MarR family winged helix-turn-helix transcriptional regulator [Amorphus orientalis]MDQ0315495.1 DNA-binding MarR family transcriptional regulator [Amorphus orientalis]